jgi:hypothetical protein
VEAAAVASELTAVVAVVAAVAVAATDIDYEASGHLRSWQLAFAVVDWQKPYEEAFRSAEPGDIETAITRLVDRYEVMGDANVRILELEGRFPAFDYLLEVSRAGHRAWIERTLLPDPSSADREQAVLSLYAATDVTVWKLLRRDLKQSRSATESVILRLVRAVLDEAPTGKDQRS